MGRLAVQKGAAVRRTKSAGDEERPRKAGFRQRTGGHGLYLRPGQTIPESGIYEVIHDLDHRAAHESVMVKGDKFPLCDTCDDRIRFRVVRTAPYIFDDEDFVQ